MKSDNREDFMKAMEKELKYLTTKYVWGILPKSSLPTSAHIIRFIQSFRKRKKKYGDLIKHKAFLCVYGGIQLEGIDFQNTFALIVN